MVRTREILGIFDLDRATRSPVTRQFLRAAERGGKTKRATDDLPKAFVLMRDGSVHMALLSVQTLVGRIGEWERDKEAESRRPQAAANEKGMN